MPVVATGMLSSPVPGIWRRLSLISEDGSIKGLRDDRLIGQLEDLGIPRHQLGLAHLLQSWQRASVPPDVALALWLLREQEDGHGCIYRKAAIPVEESSPAIRYIQLAGEVGETQDTDPTLRRVVTWLLDRQLPDGSIPLIISAGHGETGQTSRSLRALGRLGDPALEEHLAAMCSYLRSTAITQPVGHAWSYSKLEQTVVTGSTSLAVLALIERGVRDETVTEGLRFLLATQDSSGGWAEVPGYRPTVHNTFNAIRTLGAAQAVGLLT
ncbi:MAG: prenyltransferase/squalene oxidase repeat-containing protein, partial [Pseudonocardiaceae bacterium]